MRSLVKRREVRHICAALCLSIGAFSSVGAQTPANWTEPMAPFRVFDNLYYVGSAGISAWLITSPRGHILLDVGMPAYAASVEANIRALGFRLRDVKVILNTHAHFDHAGGIARLKRATGARVLISAGDRAAVERGVYIGSEDEKDFRFPPTRVDQIVRDGDRISVGGDTLTANLTPGHSAGCTSWTMPVASNGVRQSAIFFCSASVAANRLVPNPQYPGIVADYQRSFDRLRTVYADVFFAPHAEQFDLLSKRARLQAGQPNPFVQPGELQRFVAGADSSFRRSLAQQQAR
jgi:metallo-beta-lactamase class B